MRPTSKLYRRSILKGLSAMAALSLLSGPTRLVFSAEKKPKFLIVLAGFGGASIIDSFLAFRHSESPNFDTVNCFVDAEVKDIAGSPLRAVDLSRPSIGALPFAFTTNQSAFVQKHKDEMLVA